MRKVLAVFLLLTVVCVFASCDGNEDPTTTIGITTTAPTTTKAEPLSYVLTTNPGKTVPYVPTTEFVIGDESTVPTMSGIDVNITGSGNVEKPSVNMGDAPSSPTTTTKPTTTKKDDSTTTTAKKGKAASLPYYGEGSSDTQIIIDLEKDAWGGIKANSKNINIEVDGEAHATTVPLKIAAKTNADGQQYITLDLSGAGINSGSTVSFTIPEGFLVSKDGTKYNTSYSVSCSF